MMIMNIKKYVLLSFLSVLFFPPPIASAEKILFANSKWPPYSIVAEDGRKTGINTEIVVELCRRIGVEAAFQTLPWKRGLKYAKQGKVDAIYAARRTKEREQFLYYPSEPLLMERTVILAREGSGIRATELADLKGMIVGVVRGFTYGPKFDSFRDIKKIECNNDEQVVRIFAVSKRTLLAASNEEGVTRYLCKKVGVKAEVVLVLDELPSFLAFSRRLGKRGEELANKFGDVLKKMKKEGFIDKVRNKYF